MELVMGVGPMNLVITNDALYQLSYTSAATRIITKTAEECKTFFSNPRKKSKRAAFYALGLFLLYRIRRPSTRISGSRWKLCRQ